MKKCGLIIIGDLPRWKQYELWSHCKGVTNPSGKNMKKCGLIIMGDLPRWKQYELWSHCKGVTNPSGRCDMTSVKNRTYLAKS